MKIDELRQALEIHYQNEGQTLLSTDGSFPYSDKDIELVCGSLVTVRNETLQVVHLTVKQHMKSASGPPSIGLLAEMKGANVQLTLACLNLLRHRCVEPIAKLFPKRPIGAEEEGLDLSLLRSSNPFLEYACFSWLVHLTDCTSVEALEVSRSLNRTFDSPSTFGWVESCMILQPRSVHRLLIALEDVRDWIDDLQSDAKVQDSSFVFASNWCATMEQVLDEYSPVIEKQTTEIYYLDLAVAFAAHGITGTYEKHGGLLRRERCSRFSTARNPRPARKNAPPSRQLQIPSEADILDLGLFIYEPNRDIYIFSLRFEPVLFAQSASSGKRLPQLSDPEARNNNNLKDYAISGDGKYLGIVYYSHANREIQLSIVIWELEVTLDFTRRMQACPWARVVHRSTLGEHNYALVWSSPCIAFDRDSVCITPNGLVRTASGPTSFTPDNPLQRLSEKINIDDSDDHRAF